MIQGNLREEGGMDNSTLEFICNGIAIPAHFSVGGIKAHLWRKSDAPEIQYRLYNPKKPAPYPEIKPPSQGS